MPHAIETWGQYNEKSRNAYHALAMAKLLLAQRARSAIYAKPEGFYVVNTAADSWSGWIDVPATCLRGNVQSLVEETSGKRVPFITRAGYGQFIRPASPEQFTVENTAETFPDNVPGRRMRFWASSLGPHEIRRYTLSPQQVEPRDSQETPDVETDARGWPVRANWPAMPDSLFDGELGQLVGVELKGFAARWNAAGARRDVSEQENAMPITLAEPIEDARVQRSTHSTVFAQRMSHPRLLWATRCVELFHERPRARVEVRFFRKASELPEWWFVGFPVSTGATLPKTSCGGMVFQPFVDQLPNTCRDYFAIDSWVSYATPQGARLWVSHDAPLVRFGKPRLRWNTARVPDSPGRVYAMVFDNTWFTNFVGDSHGAFAFRFDLVWQPGKVAPSAQAAVSESLMSEPRVVIHPELGPGPIFMKRLHKP